MACSAMAISSQHVPLGCPPSRRADFSALPSCHVALGGLSQAAAALCSSCMSSLSQERSLSSLTLSPRSLPEPAISSLPFVLRVSARGGGRGGSSYRPPSTNRPKPRLVSGRPEFGQAAEGPPMNEQIRVPVVRLLSEDQKMLGEFSRQDALAMAREAELDLVMISADADPPVVRLVDYSKFRFEQQKKKRLQLKKAAANRVETKELKMRYSIDTHDYGVKLRAAQNFLNDGDRVKVTVQFRGREMEFKDMVVKLFDRFRNDLGELAVVEGKTQMEGRQMQMILTPNKAALQRSQAAKQKAASKSKKATAVGADDDESDAADDVEDEDVDVDDDDVDIEDNVDEDGVEGDDSPTNKDELTRAILEPTRSPAVAVESV